MKNFVVLEENYINVNYIVNFERNLDNTLMIFLADREEAITICNQPEIDAFIAVMRERLIY